MYTGWSPPNLVGRKKWVNVIRRFQTGAPEGSQTVCCRVQSTYKARSKTEQNAYNCTQNSVKAHKISQGLNVTTISY